MSEVASFTFNQFQENTYVVYDESGSCVIIDPGCYSDEEQRELEKFIDDNELNPTHLLLTHAHFDHVLGLNWAVHMYDLAPVMHEKEVPILQSVPQLGQMYGIPVDDPPQVTDFMNEEDRIEFGNTTFEILFTPGHSPGHVAFYCREDEYIISGDVIFKQSIGRTDLPGGDRNTLFETIKNKIYTLPENTLIYNGHGPMTSVGYEKDHNPFVRG